MDLFTYLMAKKGHNTHRDLFSYLLGKNAQLPSEYQRLEYIESTGTQYIDTGIKGNDSTRIKVSLKMKSQASTVIPFGDFTDTSKAITCNIGSSNSPRSRWGSDSVVKKFELTTNTYYNLDFSENGFYINGINKWTPVENTFTTNDNIHLFIATGSTNGLYGYIYECKIYDNDILIRNFIPCMRNSDNEVGLYDTVGEQFYTNAGTGKFAYKGYTFVEYIESTGTQYINTGVNADDIHYSFNIDFYGYETQPKQYSRVFGYQQVGGIFLGRKFWYGDNLDINSTEELGIFNDGRHSVFANKDYAIVDNVEYLLNTSPTSLIKNFSNKIAIFGAFQGNSGAIKNDSFSKIKLYNFKIYHSNNLIRNFIPAIRNSDSVIGLYDLVNDTFYENAGTGTFVTPTSQLSGTQSLNTSLLSSNIQEETNIDDIQEEPNLDEIEDIEQNDEPIENEKIEEPIEEEYQEL